MSLHRVNQIREQTGGAGVTIGLNLLITDDGAVSGLRGMEFGADNTYDIGAVNRPRDVRVGRNLTVAGTVTLSSTLAVTGFSEFGQLGRFKGETATGAAGKGVELGVTNGGADAIVQGYDRTGAAFIPLQLSASEIIAKTAGSERMRLASGGQVMVGHTVTSNLFEGDVSLRNTKTYGALNAAGTSNLPMLYLDANNQTVLYMNGQRLNLGDASVSGSAGALVGYFNIGISGTNYKIPYHAAS